MRLRALLVAALVGAPGLATAQAQPTSPPPLRVVPISPTPTEAPPPTLPTISAPSDLSSFTGKSIVRVDLVLEDDVWADAPPVSSTSVKAGDVFTPSAARRALREVLESGRFAHGRVFVRSEGTGVILEVRAVARKLIGRLRIEVHGARLDQDELLREADLAVGGEIVGADLAATRERVERYLARHGYPSARVGISTHSTADVSRAEIVIDAVPGPPRLVGERQFRVLGAEGSQIEPIAETYPVRVKDRADETLLEEADRGLQQALRSKGWYQSSVSHELTWTGVAERGRIVLHVRIDAGPIFTTRFEGNEHYDGAVLTSVLGLETEADRSLSHLAERVRTFYQKRGFLDVEVQPETLGSDDGAVRVILFHIVEHQRVRVASRSYPCLKLEAIKRLASGGPRSPGEIGREIDSYLDEELPGADLLVAPDPRSLGATIGAGAGQLATGARPVPLDLRPEETYVADTYQRAVQHVRELYRNEGFLHAEVGPVEVRRSRCDPAFPVNLCLPMARRIEPSEICSYDASGLPTPPGPPDPTLSCRPDSARGIDCAPVVDLRIPVRLGPRTRLWDMTFTGVKSVSERTVASAAEVVLGEAASAGKLEDARKRIVDWYKELGYYYVDVKYALEPSSDNTRARVRFDIVEGDKVTVRDIVIRGLERTSEGVVRRRVALELEQPFRTSDVRTTQERIATLGVFSSVTVSLSEPYIPQPRKDVIIDVVEREPQYIELRPGFSTGEGMRGALEYGHRNLLGDAWGITVHLQASYLPDFLILDPQVAANYGTLSTAERVATRNTLTMSWSEMGLGPTVRSQLDGVYVRDLERDFTLFKASVLGTLLWRPVRELQIRGGPDYEHNDVHLFQAQDIATYLMANPGNSDLARLLRVPDGDSDVLAGRIVATWDRRDSTFNAHRGTYMATGIEQVNSYPVQNNTANAAQQYEGHFFRLTQTVAGYVPLTSTVALAAELRLGQIVNIVPCRLPYDTSGTTPNAYCTYPDRLFFMGGVDSMRGWLQDTFIPQEYVDQIAANASKAYNDPTKFTAAKIPLRGGNFMINPRFELRFPVRLPVEGALFCDIGNIWIDPRYLLDHRLTFRADAGAGLRVDTPVGPLVFDYGVNITRQPYEDFGAFHFAIGLF